MALTAKRLLEIQYVDDVTSSLVINPASTTTYVQQIFLYNSDTAACNVKLYYVPDNSSAVDLALDQHMFLNTNVSASDTIFMDFGKPGIVMTDQNDTIQGKAGKDITVTIQIYGFQE